METRVTYKIVISDEERRKFKELAKSKGMTIQGYLVMLIKRELKGSYIDDVTMANDHAGTIGAAYEQ